MPARRPAPPVIDGHEAAHEWTEVTPQELATALRSGGGPTDGQLVVIDARSADEFRGGHIRGAQNVDGEMLLDGDAGRARARELLEQLQGVGVRRVVVHCMYSDDRARGVTILLAALMPELGGAAIEVLQLTGGFHRFLNHARSAEGLQSNTQELLEGFDKTLWRQTSSHGIVASHAVASYQEIGGDWWGGSADVGDDLFSSAQAPLIPVVAPDLGDSVLSQKTKAFEAQQSGCCGCPQM